MLGRTSQQADPRRVAPNQSRNEWSARDVPNENELRRAEAAELARLIAVRDQQIAEINAARAQTEAALAETAMARARAEAALAALRNENHRLLGMADGCAERLRAIESSTTWRAATAMRTAAGWLPRPVRHNLRRAAKVTYWVLTPHRMPARLRFFRERHRPSAFQNLPPDQRGSFVATLDSSPALTRHDDTFLTLDETAVDRRFRMPYLKTYAYPGEFINRQHATLVSNLAPSGMIDIGVDGWLLPADALKLYELAYFCGGDVLELGTYSGLSTSVIAQASHDAGVHSAIVTIDLDPGAIARSRANLQGRPGAERVYPLVADGAQAVRSLNDANRTFNFAFIDHSHAYEHVYDVCRLLDRVLKPGAFCLFHDFNDPRNADADVTEYGVHQGVLEGLDLSRFEFWGIYGCTGLFRRIS
jgi:predicted O-methyltransferase YrrM